MYISDPQIQIIKLKYEYINDELYYTSVNKTYYLRIIQRFWKKRLLEREDIYRKRVNIGAMKYRELNGRWPSGLNNVPGINGLLYNKL